MTQQGIANHFRQLVGLSGVFGSGRRLSEAPRVSPERITVVGRALRTSKPTNSSSDTYDHTQFEFSGDFGDGRDMQEVVPTLSALDIGQALYHVELRDAAALVEGEGGEVSTELLARIVKTASGEKEPATGAYTVAGAAGPVVVPGTAAESVVSPTGPIATFDGSISILLNLPLDSSQALCSDPQCGDLTQSLSALISRDCPLQGSPDARCTLGTNRIIFVALVHKGQDAPGGKVEGLHGLSNPTVDGLYKSLEADRALVHLHIVGLGEGSRQSTEMTAYWALLRLRRRLRVDDKTLHPFGNRSAVVHVEMSVSNLQGTDTASTEPEAAVGTYPAWLVALFIIVPSACMAVCLGVVWHRKRCPCVSARNSYGHAVDSTSTSAAELSAASCPSLSTQVGNQSWVKLFWLIVSQQMDKFVRHFLI